MLLRRSLLMSLVFAVTGCHGISTKNKDNVQRTSLATPYDYNLADTSCQDSRTENAVGAQTVETWNGTSFADQLFDFGPFSTKSTNADGLTSNHISGTAFGLHERTTNNCTVDGNGGVSCDAGVSASVSDARPLKVCSPTGHFDRDSLEGISLATIANIEQMHAKYLAVADAKPLAPTFLIVMPNIETVINATKPSTQQAKTVSYSETDNAAFAAGEQELFFVVYPRSQELTAKSGWSDMRLWEVPWVMDHEFSHEIFYSYYSHYKTDSATSDGFDAAKIAALGRVMRRQKPQWTITEGADIGESNVKSKIDGEKRTVGVGDTLSAVNEGFADTFAAYSIGSPQGLYCFDKTRDVANANFADGQAKVLSQAVVDKFFAAQADSSGGICDVSFQDVHALGAIMSHGIHRILSASGTDVPPSPKLQKLSLAWLTAFDAQRSDSAAPAPEDIWVMAIRAALITAQGTAASLPQATCDIVKQVFPVHAGKALASINCI